MHVIEFCKSLLFAAWMPLYIDSPSPPAADPAIGQAAEGNVELGREALAFQKQQYEENKPRQAMIDDLSRRVVDSALQTQGKSAAAADDYLAYSKAVFRPLEKQLADEAAAYDTPARREEAAGEAVGDVRTQFGVQRAMTARDLARSGVDPSSGRYADMRRSSDIAESAISANAANQARKGVEMTGRALKFDVAGLGRGLPGAGATASQVALQAGNNALGAAAAPAANARADAALVGGGFDQARAGYTAAGNLYSGLYNSQLNAWGAQQQASATGMAGLGSLAGTVGMAAMPYLFAAASSKKIKRNKRPVAASGVLAKIKKLPVEKWTYNKGVADGGTHIGPYAEDVQREFGDKAAPGGKMIDLISMNGIALAGVKALAKEVDSIKRGVKHG